MRGPVGDQVEWKPESILWPFFTDANTRVPRQEFCRATTLSSAEETLQASQLPSPRPAKGSFSSCFFCFSLSGVIVTCPNEGRMDIRRTGNTDCSPALGLHPNMRAPDIAIWQNLCFIVLNLYKLLSFKTGVCFCNWELPANRVSSKVIRGFCSVRRESCLGTWECSS